MMKKRTRLWTSVLTAAMMVAATAVMTGCSQENNSASDAVPMSESVHSEALFSGAEQINLALVLGARSNSWKPDLTLIDDELLQLCLNGGNLVVVVADGAPADNLSTITIPAPDAKKNDKGQEIEAQKNLQTIMQVLENRIAKTEEAAVLDAIAVAERNMSSFEGEKAIIVMDNGLSTAGRVEMSTLDDMNVMQIVSNISGQNNIPDLAGYKIRWYGLGQVCGSQQEQLTQTDLNLLEEFWDSILEQAGTDAVFVLSDYMHKEEILDAPSVTSVGVNVDDDVWETIAPPPTEPITTQISAEDHWVMYNDDVKFKKDSVELENADEAKKAIDAIVQNLKEYDQTEIMIIGTTAQWGNAESAETFSKGRAETIKSLFVEAEIAENRIHTAGAGYTSIFDELHVKGDIDDQGNQVEEIAKLNRAVHIMTIENRIAQYYLNQNE